MTAPPKIASQGAYTLSMEEYHSECTTGVSISSSGLRDIITRSPAHYWAASHLNPARHIRETAAMDFGRAAHAWVLGEPQFNSEFVISPYDDFRTKEARAWRDMSSDRTILKAEQFETVKAMARKIVETPQTARAFCEGKPEQSLIWQDEETGVWLKARPDWLPADPRSHFAREYKTAVTIEPRRLSQQAFSLGYDLQAALVCDGIAKVFGCRPLGVAHIVQEKEPPFLCDLRMFAPEQIDIGRARYRHALRIFYRCLNAMERGAPPHIAWPGYTKDPTYFSTPKWASDQLMEFEDDDNDGNDFGQTLAAG